MIGNLACLLIALGQSATFFTSFQPPEGSALALEREIKQAIDEAEPSIVSLTISHRRYPEPTTEQPGKLGRYVPSVGRGRAWPRNPVSSDPKLDLANPESIAENMFGTGIVLDTSGLILTTYHLVDGATKIYVRGMNGRGSYANIHAADARSDLAVLKLLDDLPDLKAVRMGTVRLNPGNRRTNSTVYRGMWVIALGHTVSSGFVDGSPSASWGILSNVRRRLNGPGREEQRTRSLNTYGCLLQTDARLTLGSSGGGLFNISGELIGLTTSLAAVTAADSSGGFAIPLDVNYRRIIDTLVRGQEVEYGFLGVQVSSTPLDRETQGLRLLSVTPGTPAADAGLIADNLGRIGDIILKIDDNPIIEQDDLFLYLGAALAGTRVKITVRDSNGNVRVVPVTLAKYGHAQPWIASNRPPAVFGLRVEYSSVLLLQMQMAGDQRAMIQGLPSGVVVRELDPGSIAEQRFKVLGVPVSRWVIREVNGKPISNPTEFYNETRSKKSVTLTLVDPTSQQSDRQITLP